ANLRVNPVLYTGDGLLIVTAYRGSPAVTASEDGPGAEIALRDAAGRSLSATRSGFACGTFCPASGPVAPPPLAAPLQVIAAFDSGPLAGPLRAERELDLQASGTDR